MLFEREKFTVPVKFFVGHGIMMVWPKYIATQVFLKSRQKFQMDSFTRKTLFQRVKNENSSGKFRPFSSRHSNTINLPVSDARRALAGSTSSDPVKSQQLRMCRHLFYRSGHAPETFLASIRTV